MAHSSASGEELCGIQHVVGPLRRQAEVLFADHFLGHAGNAGYMIAVIDPHHRVIGACLIGPASSMAAERSLVDAPWRVWCIKRLYCRDDCPIPESKLLRTAGRIVADLRGETIILCAYADPSARDSRSGLPMTGRIYYVSSFFTVGETTQTRYAVIDADGRARSTRQGKITLTKKTLPQGWHMVKIPPASVWIAIVPPHQRRVDGDVQATSHRWRKQQWLAAWKAMRRRVAAEQWIDERAWKRFVRGGIRALGAPSRQNSHQRLQSAWWPGAALQRTARPAWVGRVAQLSLDDAAALDDERTAGRIYLPRLQYAQPT